MSLSKLDITYIQLFIIICAHTQIILKHLEMIHDQPGQWKSLVAGTYVYV